MDDHFTNHAPAGHRPDLGPTFGQTLGNMRFVGLATMIYGIVSCLSLVGAIVGVPIIISANRLLGAVKILEEYRLTGLDNHLASAFHEMGRAFGIMKVLVLVSLVLTVGYFLFLFAFGGMALLAGLAQS